MNNPPDYTINRLYINKTENIQKELITTMNILKDSKMTFKNNMVLHSEQRIGGDKQYI